MAAPANKTIADLSGRWVQNKTLSDPIDPVLSLQGIGWITRKAISAAGLTLHIKQYKAKDNEGKQPDSNWQPAAPATDEADVIYFDQVITGGLKGTAETRYINGLVHGHSDWLFGTVETQTVYRSHAEVIALADPHLAGTGKEGPWLDESPQLFTMARSPNGWTATQTWGFQTIEVDGAKERRFCRNIALTTTKDKRADIRLVYDYVGELDA